MEPQESAEMPLPGVEADNQINAAVNFGLCACSFNSDDIGRSKWPKWPRKAIKPYLTSFTKFPELPIEIRHIIWRLTLPRRTIEMHYHSDRGFYSRVKLPPALKVSSDSRKAVAWLYPLSFGNIPFNKNIVFNFALDTLYFEWPMGRRIVQFLSALSDHEVNYIQSIAVDYLIDADLEYDYPSEDNVMELFKQATARMPSIKEFLIVYNLGEDWHEHGFPEGPGSLELYDEFAYEWQLYANCQGIHLDDEEGESECQELPNSEHLTEGFNVPKVGSVWGWRPTQLPLTTPPWDM